MGVEDASFKQESSHPDLKGISSPSVMTSPEGEGARSPRPIPSLRASGWVHSRSGPRKG